MPDEVFLGTVVDDFMLSSDQPIHIGVTGLTPDKAAMRVDTDSVTFIKHVTLEAGFSGLELTLNTLTAGLGAPHLQIVGPATTFGLTYLDDVQVKGGTIVAESVAFDKASAFAVDAHTVRVGDVMASGYGSQTTLKLRAAQELVMPVAPAPVDRTLDDPVQAQADHAAAVALAQADADAINAGATYTGAALDVRSVIVETFTHPVDVDSMRHVGVAQFADRAVMRDGLLLGDDANPESVIAHRGDVMQIVDYTGAPGRASLHSLDLGGASLSAGGTMGAWDVLDAVQRDAINGDAPGILRAAALCVSANGVSDAAVVNTAGGVTVVATGNGSLSTPCAFTAASVTLGAGTIAPTTSGDALEVSQALHVPTLAIGTHELTPAVDRLLLNGVLDCTGIQIDDVTLTKHSPTPDEVAAGSFGEGLDLSDKLHLQSVRLRTADDVWVELTTDSLTGAMALKNMDGQVATLHPSQNALSVRPAALRLVHDTGYVELKGTSGLLAVNVDALAFASGQQVQVDGNGSVTLEGTWSLRTDTYFLEMAPGSGTLHTNANALQLDLGVTLRSEGEGHLRIDSDQNGVSTVCAVTTLGLEAQGAVALRMRDENATWKQYAFTAKADGALLLNGYDLDVIPKDIMLIAEDDTGSASSGYWWRLSPSNFEVRYSHANRPPSLRPRLQDLRFPDSVARTYIEGGVEYSPVVTLGFYGFGMDVLLTTPRVLRRVSLAVNTLGQRDQLPTSWRVYGTEGRSGIWQELGRAGFTQTIEISGSPIAYDCYRVMVGSLSSGTSILSQDLALFVSTETQDAPVQHSFTGSHMVAVAPGQGDIGDFAVGTLVSISGSGVLDSVARGGFKARGGVSAIQVDAALPMVCATRTPRDKAVFGVISNVVVNRWYTHGRDVRLRVNGLGEGGIWVTDEGGELEVGDLLCSSSTSGHAMRQADDLLRSYTVAKCTMPCKFSGDATVPRYVLGADASGDVCWKADGTEAAYSYRVLEDSGARTAFISCVYMCS